MAAAKKKTETEYTETDRATDPPPAPNVCADIDRLEERLVNDAPTPWLTHVAHLGCVIARELRLLRAGVRP
jgi:hypothetical protein